jgi:uncharacterized repeat protein (TIGR01451 family)/fimbrial isopeptide formation D2 family protein
VVPGSASDVATSAQLATKITAITIDKSEASPEHELLRGVHDDTTTYTLKVTNNARAATNGNTVVDFLPAALEFLGCGGVDNGSVREYGNRTLTGTPAPAGTCAAPTSVDTVELAAGNTQGLAAGVYTKVTWTLPDLPASGTWTTSYRAGVPQRANTVDFDGATPPATSLRQASNLDNNTGADTREKASAAGAENGEQGLTNLAEVLGSYTGAIQGNPTDKTVGDSSSVTVTAEDLAVQKSVDTPTFEQGGIATYALDVETGEYASASGVTVTDVLPDGLCPLRVGTTDTCAADASELTATNATVQTVTHDADNSWTVVLAPYAMTAQEKVHITYQALMRPEYTGHQGAPTVSGDAYTNTVTLVGSTTTRTDVGAPDGGGRTTDDVRDASSATIASSGPSLVKTIMKQGPLPYTCDAVGTSTDNAHTPAGADALRFRVGDRVCFTIHVDFSTSSSTRNPVLVDFLPDYVTYEAGSAQPTTSNTVTLGQVTRDGTKLTWQPGDVEADGDRFVARGGTLEVRLSAIVAREPGAAPKPDITANLAKLTWQDTAGKVGFLRDQVDFGVGATPPVSVTKSHTGSGAVVGGAQVPYTITVTNDGKAADGDAIAIHDVVVRDVLPAGVTCSSISSEDPTAESCANGSGGDPSVLAWHLTGPIAAGAAVSLTYTMTVPADPRVLTDYVNTTGVVSYETDTNTGLAAVHHPDNPDSHLTECGTDPEPDCDVPAAQATDKVSVQNTSLTKVQGTAIGATNNDASAQAVIGEELTYQVTATVPPHTTVYQGVISDPMPAGVELLGATATFDNGLLAPSGAILTTNTNVDPGPDAATITLPATYTNSTATPQSFTIVATARVTTAAGNTHGTTRTNTATFVRMDAPTAGTPLAPQTASTTATVVEPNPHLAKSHSPSGDVTGGQKLFYTLTATNPAATPAPNARPTLHDAYVVDCVPAGLTNVTVPPSPDVTTALGDGSNGCAAGTTLVRWAVGDLAGGVTEAMTYSVVVEPTPVGGRTYPNTATLAGTDLADGTETPTAIERTYSSSATDTVTVAASELTKTNDTPQRAIGELGHFTVSAQVPANVNYYDAVVVDTLPAGLDASKVQLKAFSCVPGCNVTVTPLTAVGQQVGWSLGDLKAYSVPRSIALTYTVPVTTAGTNTAGTALTNSAVLGWSLTDGTDPTTAATPTGPQTKPGASIVTVTEPSVTIAKSVSKPTAAPGDTFTYTVVATNANTATTSTAHDVVVTDAVPDGVVVDQSTISDGGTLTGSTITWPVFDLAKNASKTFTYQAELVSPAPSKTDVQNNTASVTSYCSVAPTPTCAGAGGRAYVGPSSTAKITPALPHVSVAKTQVGDALAYLGKPKSFQVTITSDGDSPAYDVSATDTLPAGWTYVADSATASVAGAAAAATAPTIAGQDLTWTFSGSLAPTKTIVVTYSATPTAPGVLTNPGVGRSVSHVNSVTVVAHDANGKTGDKSDNPFHGGPATATVHVDSADLQIVKSAVGTPVAGQDVSWTLAVTNDGPDPAVGPITVTDPVPSTLTGVSASGTGWTCSVTTSTVTCTRNDTLANGGAFPAITVTGHIPAGTASGASLANTATVAGTTYDPKPINNDSTSTVTVTTSADMAVAKALSGTLTAGQDATYTIDVTNHGPSVHRGALTVTDALPTGTTFVSVDGGTGWACTTPAVGGTGDVTCTRSDDVAVGAAGRITVKVHVASGRTADVTNTATVTTGGTDDPTPGNDTSTVTTTPGTSADLSIDKSRVAGASFVAGKAASYQLSVHNDGPSDAHDVVVTDTLPSYLTYQGFAAVDGDWSCSTSGQGVTCTLADPLTAGADASVTVTVLVAADHRAAVVNIADVASTTPDPDHDDNTDTDTDTPGSSAIDSDFSITKSHPSGNVVAGGDTVTYTLEVTNEGPSDHLASEGPITVTDVMPAGMTCVSVEGGPCDDDSAPTLTYADGLAVGHGFSVRVVARVAADAGPATLTNTATVSGPNDGDPTNDTATDATTVVDRANVSLTKTVTGADPVRAGETTSFRLTAHNDGPSDADDVTVVDTLPAGMTLVAVSGTGWACTPSTITCVLPTLAAGADASVDVTVRVGSGVPDGTTLRNAATVSTTTDGDDPGDDDAHADVAVVAQADLVLRKAHVGAAQVRAGTDTSYTLDVHDAGPSDAQGPITLRDTLPTGLTFLAADGGWTCTATGQVVTCTQPGPLLAGGDATTLTLLVHVDAAAGDGDVVNTAHAESTTTDPEPGNDDDDATVTLTRDADVSVVKSHTGVGVIGDQVDFTLAVHNAGPSTATDVSVRDTLPTGLTYVSADGGPGWTCTYDDASRTVTCDLAGPLQPDTDAAAIRVVAGVEAAAYPSAANTATVSTTTPDGDPTNDVSTDRVQVETLADLSVVKTRVGDPVVGQQAHYVLTVHNDGPTEAAGTVTATDTLPPGLTFASASGDGWTCTDTAGLVTCTRDGLASGATSVVDVFVEVGPAAYPAVTNVATVGAPDADPDPSNNESEDPAPVTPAVHLAITKSVAYRHGDTVAWDVAVENQGPSATVTPLTVVDALPGALTFVSAQGKGWACADVSATVTCVRTSSLASGKTSAVRVVTRLHAPDGTSTVRNVATVSGGGGGPTSDVLSASAVVQVSGTLAFTGSDVARLAALAAALLVAGAGSLVITRRRRHG